MLTYSLAHPLLGIAGTLVALGGAASCAAAASFSALIDGGRLELQVKAEGDRLVDGETAIVKLRLTDTGGQPLRGLRPAIWIDNRSVLGHPDGREASCRERIAAYAKGSVGNRPLVDLNGHYLLVMNRDPTISVIDPLVGVRGRTNLFANILLARPGADWSEHESRRRLLVTMPRANQVAVIDASSFKVVASVNTGSEPVRVVSQQSGPLAFIGNNGDGTVSVVDVATARPLKTLAVGRGHHELQLAERESRLFVTNRLDNSVSVVDTGALTVLRTVPVSGTPAALAYSPVAGAVFVAHGADGRITALAAGSGEVLNEVRLGVPLGAVYAAPDGRTLLALATEQRQLLVVDAANLAVRHRIALAAEPYQLAFTAGFAHVRMYDTDRIALVALAALNGREAPVPGSYGAGNGGPRKDNVTVLAAGVAATPDAMAAMVVNPTDGRLHYYVEGMNATAGSFRNYGHPPQAVRATARSLQESAPGIYSAQLRLPAAGTLSAVVRLDQPRVAECYDFEAAANPLTAAADHRLQITLEDVGMAAAALPQALRIRVASEGGEAADLPAGARLRYFRAPGVERRESELSRVESGVYQARLSFGEAGAYYLQIDAAAEFAPPYLTLLVRPAP